MRWLQWQKVAFQPYVLDDLFDSFGEETISDDDIQNYDSVGKLSKMELTVTAGIFLIDTWTPAMIKVTA